MPTPIDQTRQVRYELMHGRAAVAALRQRPVGFLPIGCLERHGDHLPMGLDALKAHAVCCLAAQALGGVVFPPHHYGGIHRMTEAQLDRYTGEWGNLYTDATCQAHLIDVCTQLGRMGVRVLVLYSGHYPGCQLEMLDAVAAHFDGLRSAATEVPPAGAGTAAERRATGPGGAGPAAVRAAPPPPHVLPFAECMIVAGDHAGRSETSLMLYLDRHQVDMTALGPGNYADHGWGGDRDPAGASAALGEATVAQVIEHLRRRLEAALA